MFSKLKFDKKEAGHIRPDEDDKVWGKLSWANIFCVQILNKQRNEIAINFHFKGSFDYNP